MEKQILREDQEIKSVIKATDLLLESARSLKIDSAEKQSRAADVLASVKKELNRIDERRKYYNEPNQEAIRRINSDAKELSKPLDEIKTIIQNKLVKYQDYLMEIKRKEDEKIQKKIEKAVENGKPVPIVPQNIVEKKIETEKSKTSFRDNWTADIINEAAAIKHFAVNNMFHMLCLDERQLKAFAKLNKDTVHIPGIRFWNNKSVVSKS